MIRNNRFLLAAAAMIGIGLAPSVHNIAAVPAPSIEQSIGKKKFQRQIDGEDNYRPSNRWPYNGKNRAQRAALRGGFFSMS